MGLRQRTLQQSAALSRGVHRDAIAWRSLAAASRVAGNGLLVRLELRAHVVLLSDENELSRRPRIIVAQEVMHHEAELFGLNSGFAV